MHEGTAGAGRTDLAPGLNNVVRGIGAPKYLRVRLCQERHPMQAGSARKLPARSDSNLLPRRANRKRNGRFAWRVGTRPGGFII